MREQLSYLTLDDCFYSVVKGSVLNPEFLQINEELMRGLELDQMDQATLLDLFSGKGQAIALAYDGHQFGTWNVLGDGRALLVGEVMVGEVLYDLHLKGSGPTPYSRRGDGYATLSSALREYLISEAMFYLGVPTTRSLAVLKTNQPVIRQEVNEGAILVRVAKSHLRVGTFSYAYRMGMEQLQNLVDFAIAREGFVGSYLEFFEEVVRRTASLIATWQSIGFVHGVMNTDNLLISGETIDYGPCAFMDVYKKDTVFSSIDQTGRYAFGNQPFMGGWNLARLAEAMLPLFGEADEALQKAKDVMERYHTYYENYYLSLMRKKLGLYKEEAGDLALVERLLDWMEGAKDYTKTFRDLSDNPTAALFPGWEVYHDRLRRENVSLEVIKERMKKHNPFLIPRNSFVEQALEEAVSGDFSFYLKLLEAIRTPFEKKEGVFSTIPTKEDHITFCNT